MVDSLPTEYDCIVIGTGMTESVVAAAASRIGKRVLHLDSNEYYGGLWASFNFEGLQNWLADCRNQAPKSEQTTSNFSDLVKEGETLIKAGNQFSLFSNIEEDWYISEDLAESLAGLPVNKKTQTDGDRDKTGGGDIETEKLDDESEKHERDMVETEKDDEGYAPSKPKYWSRSKLQEEYRRFNLDLAPKLLFARGSLVELLISSNIARYAEFRSVTRVLTWLEGQLEPVPCSRADVFATRHVSVVEKRMLMKLLTACMQYEIHPQEFEGFENNTFLEYLKSRKLTPNLIHYVLYSIAMATDTTPCLEGVTRAKRFLNSLGRYGNTPFLWPMYGSGEIPQCFCRLCAVFGGVYHLKRAAEAVIVGPGIGDNCEKKCLGILSAGQRLNTNQLVLGVGHAPPPFVESTPTGGLSRGIFITDRSILPADKESLTLLQFPSMNGKGEPVTVIELGPSTNACPKGMHVVHMTCKQKLTAKEDLQHVVEKLLYNKLCDTNMEHVLTDTQSTQTLCVDESGAGGDESEMEKSDKPDKSVKAPKPQVLWSLHFNCPETSNCDLSANTPPNVFVCSGPDLDLDFEVAVNQARDIFSKMYPDCEFLPRAPDPEEIILEGDENVPGPSFEETAETNDMHETQNDQVGVEEAGAVASGNYERKE